MPKTKKADSDPRWWESYFVRYLIGTITGAAIIYFLSASGKFKYLFDFPGMLNKDNTQYFGLLLLGVSGFAFCYVASGPMLVFHATRGIYSSTMVMDTIKISISITALFALLAFGLMGYSFIATPPYLFILFAQCTLLLCSFTESKKELIQFYKKLAGKRTDDNHDEYIESYRHLREHGNAIMIIPLEIILGIMLFYLPGSTDLEKNITVGAVFFIWILPAGLAWFIANMLERDMALE